MNVASMSILLIEDDVQDADLLQRQLAGQNIPNWKLEHVENLRSALKRLAAGGIDLVLSDLNLPDSTGFDTCGAILKQFPAMPIVVLTGLDDDKVALDAVRSGAQDYLVKGQIQGSWLVRVIRYAVERKQSQQEVARLASFPEMDPNPVFECSEDGRITYLNSAAQRRFPDLQAAGTRHPLLMDRGALRGKAFREIKIGSAYYEQHSYWVGGSQVIRNYILDITERKEIERVKEELIGNVSHELRT
ncbi:MAG: response regulator, partial [Candidatus Omnitrophica bacterium]|nr:response regulator [Candidatus Omnitrophota bacterium]